MAIHAGRWPLQCRDRASRCYNGVPPYAETQTYVERVLRKLQELDRFSSQ